MIKNSILGIVLLSLAFVSCKENATSKIDSTNLVKEGDVVEGIFKVANKGKTDLVITDASASCGCTVPEWPKEAIKPGDSAEIKFSFNSAGRTGKQSKTITLQTNSENVTEMLRISGTVTPKS